MTYAMCQSNILLEESFISCVMKHILRLVGLLFGTKKMMVHTFGVGGGGGGHSDKKKKCMVYTFVNMLQIMDAPIQE